MFGSAPYTSISSQLNPLFRQTETSNTGFGGTSAFSSNDVNLKSGTVSKYLPLTGTESIIKHRNSLPLQVRYCAITIMKEYQTKSFEELRHEDYLAKRKGPQQTTCNIGFHQISTSNGGGTGLFSTSPPVSQGFGHTSSVFGQTQVTNLFGTNSKFLGQTAGSPTSPFHPQPKATISSFGNIQTNPFEATSNTGSFSIPSTQPAHLFGTTNYGNFGTHTSTKNFESYQNKPTMGTLKLNPCNFMELSSTFGQQQQPPLFGGNKTSKIFGTTSGLNTYGQQQPPLFSGNKTTTNTFGATSGLNTYGQHKIPLFSGNKTTPNFFSATNSEFGQTSTSQKSFGGFGATLPQTNSLFNSSTINKPVTGDCGTVESPSKVFMGVNLNQPQQQTSTNLSGLKTNSVFTLPPQIVLPQTTVFPGFGQQNVSSEKIPFNDLSLVLNHQQQLSQFKNGNHLSVHDQILTITIPYQHIDCLRKFSSNGKGITNKMNQNNSQTVTNDGYSTGALKKQFRVPLKLRTLPSNSDIKTLFEGLEFTDTSIEENLFAAKPPRNPRRLYISKTHVNDMDNVSRESSIERVTYTGRKESSLDRSNNEFQAINDSENVDIVCESSIQPVTYTSREKSSTVWKNDQIQVINYCKEIVVSDESSIKHVAINDCKEIEIFQRHSTCLSSITQPTTAESLEQSILITLTEGKLNSNPTGIICSRSDYYTIPSLDELAEMVTPDGKCIVEGFIIGRYGYGNVFFPDEFDVAGINIDKNIHFSLKEVEIYVDDENKPPFGHELNRHALITLDKVYPRNMKTLQPITDVDKLVQMNYEGILRAACKRQGTNFVEYRPETGSWVFEVIRDGLSDEEDAMISTENLRVTPLKRSISTQTIG